jgi:Na+/melibiose symporter-like transporter
MTPERAFGLNTSLTPRRRRRKLFAVRAPPHVSRAIVVYAMLWALLDLVALLPGNPTFSSNWGLVGSLLIQSLVVWRLANGSALAWLFGLLMALGAVVFIPLTGPPFDATEIAFAVVCLAQAGVLLAPPVRCSVWPDHKTPTTAA